MRQDYGRAQELAQIYLRLTEEMSIIAGTIGSAHIVSLGIHGRWPVADSRKAGMRDSAYP